MCLNRITTDTISDKSGVMIQRIVTPLVHNGFAASRSGNSCGNSR
jgi:hypothetical protein